ncbi:MAG: putative LPS assembly protein LptD, partial [Bacteroidota bacterium]
KGDPDFALNRSFQVSWNHSMDQKAKPGTNFSANVTAGSTSFNQYQTTNPIRNVQNQLQSSITYSKTWGGKNLTLSANHNQNNFSRLINVTLPDAGFSIPTLYPLQRKNPIGSERWYEKIGIGYNGTARNQVAFYDTALRSFGQLLDTLQLGAQHRLPITMSVPPLGNLIVSPAISYEETWFTNRIRRRWNETNKKVDTVSLSKGFYTDRQMSFSLSINTALFGTVVFPKSKLKAIRHTVRPQFSFYYRPNLSANKYDIIRYDTSSQNTQQFSQFNVPGNLFSGYGYGKGGGISFGIDNNLEAKWRGKKDSVDKKIRLIDGFGFNSAYNFLAPAFKLSPFNLYIRSTLFEKLNINATANLDPYRVDSNGQNINEYAWSGSGFSVGRITNANISMSTRFQSKPRDPKQAPNPNTVFNQQVITDPSLMQDKMLLQDYMQRNPADFVDFNIPWSVDVNFALTLNRVFDRTKQAFTTDLSSSLQFNNSFSLTPKWNFTTNGFYDLDTKKLTQLNLSIAREMHCWQMAISVSPIGQSRFFTITISPRSSILQDLRINRTRAFYDF